MSKRIALVGGATALGAAVALGIGGASLAQADTATPTPSSSTTAGQLGFGPGPGNGQRQHTLVTGDEATKVSDAVKAKDNAITVVRVLKDQDGTYDVIGIKANDRVFVEVSKDLKTVEVKATGPGRGMGPGGGRGMGAQSAAASDADLAKIKEAVKAKDAAITVDHARKLADGSYRAGGIKDNARVRITLDKNFGNVTVETATPGQSQGRGRGACDGDRQGFGQRGGGRGWGQGAGGAQAPASAATNSAASFTV